MYFYETAKILNFLIIILWKNLTKNHEREREKHSRMQRKVNLCVIGPFWLKLYSFNTNDIRATRGTKLLGQRVWNEVYNLFFREDDLNYTCLITSELRAFRRYPGAAAQYLLLDEVEVWSKFVSRAPEIEEEKEKEKEGDRGGGGEGRRGDEKGAWKDHWACPDRSSRKPAALLKRRGQWCYDKATIKTHSLYYSLS